MYILGLSFDYHDSAAALLSDGEIVAAAEEERFSRTKNDSLLPERAIAFCLEQAGISAKDLEKVVYYEKARLKFERIVCGSLRRPIASRNFLHQAVHGWLDCGKLWPEHRVSTALSIPASRITSVHHHESHAGAAFFNSPFEEAAVVTLDGVGEYEAGTISKASGSRVKKLKSIKLPHSLGLFYSAITSYLGFKVNEDEYKVMGMAGFGEPVYYDIFQRCFKLKSDGTFELDQKFFDFYCSTTVPYTPALVEACGPARRPEAPFSIEQTPEVQGAALEECKRFANIAASAQKVAEEVVAHVASSALKMCKTNNLCLSGGVALNSLANGKLRRTVTENLYIHPAAGDAGGALGAAQYYWHVSMKRPKSAPTAVPYLGKRHSTDSVEKAIRNARLKHVEHYSDSEALLRRAAAALHAGKVIGWLHGRFEWGPRALGCRSILANPTIADMQAIVNTKIKFREPFRPFAPAVLEERATEFFDLPGEIIERGPEYFMLSVCEVRADKKSVIPATTHVDGTARVQLVRRSWNERYYDLTAEFAKLSGVPVILNTSFNRRGEPIVNTPEDAIKTFEWSGLDCLVLEDHFIEKKR